MKFLKAHFNIPVPNDLSQLKPSLLACGILLLAFCLRLYGLCSTGLWNDEGHSYLLASLPFHDLIVAATRLNLNPPLFYLTLKPLVGIFPQYPWVIRIPGLIASLTAIYAVYVWLRTVSNEKTACFGASLLSISPMAIFFVHEGRSYSTTALFYLLSILVNLCFLKNKNLKLLILGSLINFVLIFLHSLGIVLWACSAVLFISQWLIDQDHPRPRKILLQWATAQVIICIPFLFYFQQYFANLNTMTTQPSIYQLFWEKNFWLRSIFHASRNLIPGDASAKNHMPIPEIGVHSGFLSLLFACLLIRSFFGPDRRKVAFLLLGIYTPLFTLSITSDLFTAVYWMGRTEVFVLPLFVMLLGLLVNQGRSQIINLVSWGVFVFAGLMAVFLYYFSADYPRKQWDALSAQAAFKAEAPQVVIFDVRTRFSVVSHALAIAPKLKIMPYPAKASMQSGRSVIFQFLKARLEIPQNISEAPDAARDIVQGLKQERLSNLVFIHTATDINRRIEEDPTDRLLVNLLTEAGCRTQGDTEVFPMDWHNNGDHVVRKFNCPFDR